MNENFSDVLDQKYRLDELFALPQNRDIKALYNYLDNIAKEGGAAMPPMDFWISEMEKDLPFNESDANVRDVRKDTALKHAFYNCETNKKQTFLEAMLNKDERLVG